MEELTRDFLSGEAKKIIEFANKNLEQLNGKFEQRNTTADYYLGVLRRQTIILYDLIVLLENSPHDNFTSMFILCRCLTDDFLFLAYLKTTDNGEDENIIRINGNAYDKSFKSLKIIAESNHKHFDGKYPFYLTIEEFEKVKNIFKSKEENHKYFKNIEDFTFKSFLQLTQIADKIEDFELSKTTMRAFYLWKEFSDFIHYSNITFELEINRESVQTNFKNIEEVFMYAVNTIEMSFRYFIEKYHVKFIIDDKLSERYLMNI